MHLKREKPWDFVLEGKMVRRVACAVFAASMVSGCSADFKDFAEPGKVFGTTLASNQSLERDAWLSLQDENRLLLFLSSGGYSCGDPNYRPLQQKLKDTDILASVEKRYKSNPSFAYSLKLITEYAQLLENIDAGRKSSEETLQAVAALVSSGAATVPGAGPYVPLVKPATAVIERVRFLAVTGAVEALAQASAPKLDEAALWLADAFDELQAAQNETFHLWDSCARERLIFIRDAPRGKVDKFSAQFSQASGIELADAYLAYREKRRKLSGAADLRRTLDKLLAYNQKLAAGIGGLTPKDVANAAREVVELEAARDATAAASDIQRRDAKATRRANEAAARR